VLISLYLFSHGKPLSFSLIGNAFGRHLQSIVNVDSVQPGWESPLRAKRNRACARFPCSGLFGVLATRVRLSYAALVRIPLPSSHTGGT